MLVRIAITLLLYGGLAGYAYPKIKEGHRKEKAAFIVIVCCSFYSALSFILNENLPNIDDLVSALFDKPVDWLISALGPGQSERPH